MGDTDCADRSPGACGPLVGGQEIVAVPRALAIALRGISARCALSRRFAQQVHSVLRAVCVVTRADDSGFLQFFICRARCVAALVSDTESRRNLCGRISLLPLGRTWTAHLPPKVAKILRLFRGYLGVSASPLDHDHHPPVRVAVAGDAVDDDVGDGLGGGGWSGPGPPVR